MTTYEMDSRGTESAIDAFAAEFRHHVTISRSGSNVIPLKGKVAENKPAPKPTVERGKFGLTPLSEIDDTPPEWAVKGIIPQDGLTGIFGKPKSGKSFAALDMAFCVATGKDYHGHAVKQGKVIYIAGEGRHQIKTRAAAWAKQNGANPMENFIISNGATVINTTMAAEQIPIIAQHGEPRLIIIDTLKRNLVGDENNPKDMQAFIKGCDRFRDYFPDVAVIVVHHSGHANEDRAMGSINFLASLDAEYKVSRAGNGNVTLECTAMKDAPEAEPMLFEMLTVGKSLVPAFLGAPSKGSASKNKVIKAEGEAAIKAWNNIVDDCMMPEGIEDAPWRSEFYKLWDKGSDANVKAFQRARRQLYDAEMLDSTDAPFILKA